MIPRESLDSNWHQMCVSWDGNTGQAKFYKDGKLIKTHNRCKRTTIGAGKLYLGHSERKTYGYGRKDYDSMLITGYVLWDRILTDGDILESFENCRETKWNPLATWDDFYTPVQTNAGDYLITPSQCRKYSVN